MNEIRVNSLPNYPPHNPFCSGIKISLFKIIASPTIYPPTRNSKSLTISHPYKPPFSIFTSPPPSNIPHYSPAPDTPLPVPDTPAQDTLPAAAPEAVPAATHPAAAAAVPAAIHPVAVVGLAATLPAAEEDPAAILPAIEASDPIPSAEGDIRPVHRRHTTAAARLRSRLRSRRPGTGLGLGIRHRHRHRLRLGSLSGAARCHRMARNGRRGTVRRRRMRRRPGQRSSRTLPLVLGAQARRPGRASRSRASPRGRGPGFYSRPR